MTVWENGRQHQRGWAKTQWRHSQYLDKRVTHQLPSCTWSTPFTHLSTPFMHSDGFHVRIRFVPRKNWNNRGVLMLVAHNFIDHQQVKEKNLVS
jgi:hypothetical protein